jgi:hypothetical protein
VNQCGRCGGEIVEGRLCANCLAFFWRLQWTRAGGAPLGPVEAKPSVASRNSDEGASSGVEDSRARQKLRRI